MDNLISLTRVLHVDDEPILGEITRLYLENKGAYTVDSVTSGEEALLKLKEQSYSCVISDYEMPEMNGLELLSKIRESEPEMPFILLTGHERELVLIDAFSRGADFYIQKGTDIKALITEIVHTVQYAIDKRDSVKALKRRERILETTGLVGNLFLSGLPFDIALEKALTLFGLSIDVDDVRLFTYRMGSSKTNIFAQKSYWNRFDYMEKQRLGFLNKSSYLVLSQSDLKPEHLFRLNNGEPVFFFAEDSQDNTFFSSLNIKTMAIIPIFVDEKLWGIIWFADCITSRNFPEKEVDILLTISALIGSAIQQNHVKQRLIEAREQYRSLYHGMNGLFDQVPDIYWAEDPAGGIVFANRPVFGPSETLIRLRDKFKSSDKHEISEISEHSPKNHIMQSDVTLDIDDNPKIFEVIQTTYPDNMGRIAGRIHTARDVTNDRRNKSILVKERARYKTIFENFPTGLISVSDNGQLTGINQKARVILNLDNSDDMNALISELSPSLKFMWTAINSMEAAERKRQILNGYHFSDESNSQSNLYYTIKFLDEKETNELLISIDMKNKTETEEL